MVFYNSGVKGQVSIAAMLAAGVPAEANCAIRGFGFAFVNSESHRARGTEWNSAAFSGMVGVKGLYCSCSSGPGSCEVTDGASALEAVWLNASGWIPRRREIVS